MPQILRAEAVCLRRTPHRETSKLVTVFTREHGKLVLQAKGARRPKSRFGAGLEVLTYGRIIFYRRETRTVNTISDMEILDDFPGIRADPARLHAGAVMAEFTDRVFEPEAAHAPVFTLLVEMLRALDTQPGDFPALAFAYMLKAAGRIGLAPQLDHCVGCRRPRAAVFSPRRGGLFCGQCASREHDALKVTLPVVKRLRLLYYGSAGQNLHHTLPAEVRCMVFQFLQFHFEQLKLRSLRFLES